MIFDAIRVLYVNSIEHRRLEVECAHLMQKLSRMVETDPLTRLFNRRAFEGRAGAMYKPPWSKAWFTALIMFDIDHFKHINNTYGHAVDDEALRTIARLCHAEGPLVDVMAYIDGREFVVMVWVDSLAQARAIADHLRRRIAEVTVPTGTDLSYHMTANSDVAVASAANGPQLEPLLRRIDHLFYVVKLAGRNCMMADRLPASSSVALAADRCAESAKADWHANMQYSAGAFPTRYRKLCIFDSSAASRRLLLEAVAAETMPR